MELGYADVLTYLNSGNVIFSTDENDEIFLADKLRAIIQERFGLYICICDNTIFWSFDRMKYAKANWWKQTASAGIGKMITIRTANTLKKIVRM